MKTSQSPGFCGAPGQCFYMYACIFFVILTCCNQTINFVGRNPVIKRPWYSVDLGHARKNHPRNKLSTQKRCFGESVTLKKKPRNLTPKPSSRPFFPGLFIFGFSTSIIFFRVLPIRVHFLSYFNISVFLSTSTYITFILYIAQLVVSQAAQLFWCCSP